MTISELETILRQLKEGGVIFAGSFLVVPDDYKDQTINGETPVDLITYMHGDLNILANSVAESILSNPSYRDFFSSVLAKTRNRQIQDMIDFQTAKKKGTN